MAVSLKIPNIFMTVSNVWTSFFDANLFGRKLLIFSG